MPTLIDEGCYLRASAPTRDRLLRHVWKLVRRLVGLGNGLFERVVDALSMGLWLTLALGPVVAVILGPGAPRSWAVRGVAIGLYGFSLAQPWLRERDARVRAQGRTDELVCQFVLGRRAGARKVKADCWIVMPSRSRNRRLRTIELPGLRGADTLVDLNPRGEIYIGLPKQVDPQERQNLQSLTRLEENR